MSESTLSAPDLTQRPPRSARCRLGGYALLPRCLDKGRAARAGKAGEYKYGCPLDQQFLTFAGIDAERLDEQIAAGKGDGEILKWIEETGAHRRAAWEIEQWSAWQDHRVPTSVEMRDFFQELQNQAGPQREDVGTWADLLDLDDYVSFGGKA
jgi:hypothetical protein